jgi:hypothetical protein
MRGGVGVFTGYGGVVDESIETSVFFLDVFCGTRDAVFRRDIDLHEIDNAREVAGAQVLHGGEAFLEGAAANEDEVGRVREKEVGECEADASVGYV